MSHLRRLRSALILVSLIAPVSLYAQEVVRVATYNIRFLSAQVTQEGERLARLRSVIELLDADVIGLQEIADRRALELLFPPNDWDIVIDDDSSDSQDVAVAVRHPYRVTGFPSDLDADDEHFAFPGSQDDDLFPTRRDLLTVRVSSPNTDQTFVVFVVHAKSRRGGRATTDPRREGAARAMIRLFERNFDEEAFVLVGDFNDTPDDRSLNILETGDPDAPGGPEEIEGPFLLNVTEPLYAQGHVSFGRSSADVIGGRIDTIDPDSRERNNENRGTDVFTGDALFDQLLIPMRIAQLFVQGSAHVFDNPIAVEGGAHESASDHLPVFADFVFGGLEDDDEDVPVSLSGLRIAAVLPDPVGVDEGQEEVRLRNTSSTAISLSGWTLQDRAGNTVALSGSIASGVTRGVRIAGLSMPLNNSGDDLSLITPTGEIHHHVTYNAAQVVRGQFVEFEE